MRIKDLMILIKRFNKPLWTLKWLLKDSVRKIYIDDDNNEKPEYYEHWYIIYKYIFK
jgi:hypothetical protein